MHPLQGQQLPAAEPAPAGHQGAAPASAGQRPHARLDDPAAVQGQAWQQVEDGDEGIGHDQRVGEQPGDATVQQGVYEASNVNTGDEMVMMMEALRRAEAGQRVINVYDDLMGRAVTTFGESVR